MYTTVFREILDKSIRGEKIYLGIIDYIEGLITDQLQVPKAGFAGVGSIDGASFSMGVNQRVGFVGGNTGEFEFLNVVNSGGIARASLTKTGDSGEMQLRNTGGTIDAIISADGSTISYLIYKLIIGGDDTSEWAGGYIMEVHGQLAANALDIRPGGIINSPEGYIVNLAFDDHLAAKVFMTDVTTTLYALESAFLSGTSLISPWNILKDLTSSEANQLKNIDSSTIDATQWGYLGSMDQSVATADNVQFNRITIADYLTYLSSAKTIDLAQFERLADINQNLATTDSVQFDLITANGIRLGGTASANEISVVESKAVASVNFEFNGSVYGTTSIEYVRTGNLITLFVKSEPYDQNPGSWGSGGDPNGFLIYESSGGVSSHFSIDLSAYSDLAYGSSAIEPSTYLAVLFRNNNGAPSEKWSSLHAVAYIDSSTFLRIKWVKDVLVDDPYYESDNHPPINDFDLLNNDQVFVPKSFSLTYRKS